MEIMNLKLAEDLEIEMTFDRGKLAYTFERMGKRYGNAVKLEKRNVLSIAAASLQLFANALSTRDAVDARDSSTTNA